ncbi:DNA cytosine methyltransferase [Streptomyces tubercidicus]|uniref:DNA cytosine methyltransferase n=1 Tax=Streptomyces tubercidicus TaxID=47759 RepID=UPI003464F97B
MAGSMARATPGPRIGSLCTGYGGLDMAVQRVFGGTTAWVSDIDPGACRIIDHRMPGVPNIGDLTTAPWSDLEPVDIVTGGYPCQPFSHAGLRKGTDDERHIWPHIAHALGVLRPHYAVFENVAGHLRRGFDTVLADLASLGFDVEWVCLRASEVGAPHPRERLIILATAQDADREPGEQRRQPAPGQAQGREARADAGGRGGAPAAHTSRSGLPRHSQLPTGRDALRPGVRIDADGRDPAVPALPDEVWGRYLPAIRRWEAVTSRPAPRAIGVRGRLSPAFVEWMMGLPAGHVTEVPGLSGPAQLKALGNGVVPRQAAAALEMLLARSMARSAILAA